jgi:acyl transferase domain-containing protein
MPTSSEWHTIYLKSLDQWRCCAGNGSQWAGMARELLEGNKVFHTTVMECASVLELKYGFDLLPHFSDDKGFGDPLSSALGLVAIQIGLVNVLREEYDIRPAGVFGHSAGKSLP